MTSTRFISLDNQGGNSPLAWTGKLAVSKISIVLLLILFSVLPVLCQNSKPQPSAADQESTNRLKADVAMLAGKIGARSLTSSPQGLGQSALYIEQTLKDLGYQVTRQEYRVDSTIIKQRQRESGITGAKFDVVGSKARNIIANIKGSQNPKNEIIIVGAHYDSFFDCPAANDNASGVACLLELARAFAHKQPGKTMRFVAFANEEPPFFRSPDMGSDRYAKQCSDLNEKIIAMFSLETLGYYSDRPNSQRYPKELEGHFPHTGNFVAFVSNQASSNLVKRCISNFKQAVDFPCQGIAASDSVEGIDFSDQQSFWHYGFPALMVTDTALMRYPFYHSKNDTPDKVNYHKLAQVTKGITAILQNLAHP